MMRRQIVSGGAFLACLITTPLLAKETTSADRTGGQLEELLRDVELPQILRDLLSLIAGNPGTVASLIAGLVVLLTYLLMRSIYKGRRYRENLGEAAESFPRPDWPDVGRLNAEHAFHEGLRVFRKRGDGEGLAVHHGALGMVYFQRGNEKLAEQHFLHAIDHFESVGHREGLAVYCRLLAQLYRAQDKDDRALAFAERSYAMYKQVDLDPDDVPDVPGGSLRELLAELRGTD